MSLRGRFAALPDEAISSSRGRFADSGRRPRNDISDWLYQPFIGEFPICQIKSLPVSGLHAESFFTGTAPACHDLRDLILNSLPGERKWTFRVFRIRATFNCIYHHSHHFTTKGLRCYHQHSTVGRAHRLFRGLSPACRSMSDSALNLESHSLLR